MSVIKSGLSTNELSITDNNAAKVSLYDATSDTGLTIDPSSTAARTSVYDTRGNFTGMKISYAASLDIKTATAAGTGPFASIYGSETKTIRVQRIIVSGTCATAAVYGDIIVKKTSTAISGGTATALTAVPKDSASAASTATNINYYTVLATPGTVVGAIASQTVFLPITGTPAVDVKPVIFDWTAQGMNEAPVLRGIAQGLELNFGTTTTNAPTLTITIEYTEES